jgi:hypothetical protein
LEGLGEDVVDDELEEKILRDRRGRELKMSR